MGHMILATRCVAIAFSCLSTTKNVKNRITVHGSNLRSMHVKVKAFLGILEM